MGEKNLDGGNEKMLRLYKQLGHLESWNLFLDSFHSVSLFYSDQKLWGTHKNMDELYILGIPGVSNWNDE